MQSSLAANNYQAYQEYAHALKGSSGSIGAIGLYNISKNINDSCTTTSDNITTLKEAYCVYRETKDQLLEYIKTAEKPESNKVSQ